MQSEESEDPISKLSEKYNARMEVFDLSLEDARAKRIVHGSGVTNSYQMRIEDRRYG